MTVNKITAQPIMGATPENRSPRSIDPSRAVVTGSKAYIIVALSGRTYLIAELWNSDVEIVTAAFRPISRKNTGLNKIPPEEIVVDSKISARDRNIIIFVAC